MNISIIGKGKKEKILKAMALEVSQISRLLNSLEGRVSLRDGKKGRPRLVDPLVTVKS